MHLPEQFEQWPVSRLIEYVRNPRKNDHAVAAVAAAIHEFGFRVPIIARSDGTVVDGHLRLKAARQLGLETVPVMLADDMSEPQVKAFRLSVNKLAELAGWDNELLSLELADLDAAGFDLNLTGFSDEEIEKLLIDIEGDPADDGPPEQSEVDDEVPDVPFNPVSRTGDVWMLGAHRLICGDAGDPTVIAALMQGERAALCFTSPPYGTQRDYTDTIVDWDALMRSVFASLPMATTGQVLVNLGLIHREQEVVPYWDGWLSWMRQQGWRRFGWYVWDQGPGLPGDWSGRFAPAFEFVFHFNRKDSEVRRPNKNVPCIYAGRDTHLRGDGTSAGGMRNKDGSKTSWNHVRTLTQETKIADSVIRIMRHKGKIGQDIDHPAVFPVALPQFVLEAYSDTGDIVFEPFCGSGTTMLAAQRSGRQCRLVEIAPQYVDVAVIRFQQNFPDVPVSLAATGQTFNAVAEARLAPATLKIESAEVNP